MNDEIKEINIPENVLVALSDLTNGALNYYKSSRLVMLEHRTILDYLISLQKRLDDETLCKEIAQGHRDEVRDRESRELEELKDYKSRIDKAIEIAKAYSNMLDTRGVLLYSNLLNVLQGSDKE